MFLDGCLQSVHEFDLHSMVLSYNNTPHVGLTLCACSQCDTGSVNLQPTSMADLRPIDPAVVVMRRGVDVL